MSDVRAAMEDGSPEATRDAPLAAAAQPEEQAVTEATTDDEKTEEVHPPQASPQEGAEDGAALAAAGDAAPAASPAKTERPSSPAWQPTSPVPRDGMFGEEEEGGTSAQGGRSPKAGTTSQGGGGSPAMGESQGGSPSAERPVSPLWTPGKTPPTPGGGSALPSDPSLIEGLEPESLPEGQQLLGEQDMVTHPTISYVGANGGSTVTLFAQPGFPYGNGFQNQNYAQPVFADGSGGDLQGGVGANFYAQFEMPNKSIFGTTSFQEAGDAWEEMMNGESSAGRTQASSAKRAIDEEEKEKEKEKEPVAKKSKTDEDEDDDQSPYKPAKEE